MIFNAGAEPPYGVGTTDRNLVYYVAISIAIGSSSEAEHHLITCGDLGLLDEVAVMRLTDQIVEVRRMLFGLRAALLRREQEERIKGRPPLAQHQPE